MPKIVFSKIRDIHNIKVDDINGDNSEDAKKFYIMIYDYELLPWGVIEIDNEETPISGDLIFNFNKTKISYFNSIIESDLSANENKKKCNDLLNELSVLSENILNMTAYPVTGGLNNIKQNIGNDRFDSFVSALYLYYQGYDSLILDSGSINMCFPNRKLLQKFLDKYKGENAEQSLIKIMNFLYQIDDKELIKELINNGKKALTTTDDIINYCSLAIEFWLSRAKSICEDEDRFYNERQLKNNIKKFCENLKGIKKFCNNLKKLEENYLEDYTPKLFSN